MIHAPSTILNLRSGAPSPRLCALLRERLLPNGAERGRGRDRLRVELEMEDGGFFRVYRRIERRRERGGRLHCGAEAAVAGEAHYAALGIEPLGRDRGGNPVTHRARDRSELGREAAEAIEAVNPAGIIAGTIAQDRLGLEPLAQADHDLAEVDRARNGVDELDLRSGNVEQRVALGGQLAEPAADKHEEIGRLDAREELRVGTDAEIAGI